MSLSPARVSPTDLATLDAMERDALDAIENVTNPDEAERLLAQVKAVHEAVRLARLGAEYEKRWSSVRLRAERRHGELLGPPMSQQEAGAISAGNSSNAERVAAHKARQVAAVPDEVFETFIETADALSRAGLIRKAREAEADQRGDQPMPAPPEGKYRCIVIDPPWPMPKIVREERPLQADRLDYPTMTLDEIGAIPVPDLIHEEGAHVYLWVTHKFLPAGLELLREWGCRYECMMTWVKPTGMTPYSWMYNTEHVLFARAGAKLPIERMGLKLAFEAPVERHSAKPDVFYELARQATPGPRIDLFARREREGFEVWGDEVAHVA